MVREELLGSLVYVCRLRAFLSLDNFEFHVIAFLKTLITFGGNRAVVHKNIRPFVAPDESVAFGVVKPFDRTFHAFHFRPPRARTLPHRGRALHLECCSLPFSSPSSPVWQRGIWTRHVHASPILCEARMSHAFDASLTNANCATDNTWLQFCV